jgi:translocation-and-assembly-module (TAM) inner membrane subunit TamB-like protein
MPYNKKYWKILTRVFLVILLFLIVIWGILQTPAGQNWLAIKITNRLSRELQTKISIKHVDFSFFNKMNIKGVLVEDRNRDTLLYAGNLQVKITDWFFFKDVAEVKYVGLEDAVIKFQRTDSNWNFKFLQDYFAPAPGLKPKKKAGIHFDLKVVEMKNVVIIKNDAWNGQNLYVRLTKLNMDAKELSLSGKNIDINSLSLVQPVLRLYDYPKRNPAISQVHNSENLSSENSLDSLLKWNASGLVLHIDLLKIEDGFFGTERSGAPRLTYFDSRHLQFSKIEGQLNNINWNRDTISMNANLKAVERSGLLVKSLKADIKLHPQAMEFLNLDLRTNNSVIKNYFVMKYKDIRDMNDFIHKVRMEANFTDADIASDDIAFFAPSLKSWQKRIRVTGKARGTVDELKGDKLVIQAGNNTYLNGDLTLSGLPNINQTFIDFKANEFRTTYTDAVKMLPQIRNISKPHLERLSYLYFNGSFTGFIRDFVTYGTIRTNLGNITSDLNMKLPVGREPIYSGTIASNGFRLGEFTGTPLLGSISFDGRVRGQSFKPRLINADIDGRIEKLEYNKYTYQNIVAKGKLKHQLFDGFFSINDPNAELTLNGIIDFSNKIPKFNLLADVKTANLRELKLTPQNLSFNGKFNLNFEGNKIDNFLGDARIFQASLMKDGDRLSFDSLIVSSKYLNGIKTLKAQSNEFDATVAGEFDLNDLPDAFKLFLNKYYPAYIKAPKRQLINQSFTFDITTRIVDDYMPMINKNLAGFNNSHISGKLNIAQNQFQLQADVPQFAYKQYEFSNALIKGDGNFDRLILSGDVGNVIISDSLNLPQTKFNIEARNDISQITINTTANQAINQASVAAQVQTFNDGVKIVFAPSSFVLNDKTWSIQQGGELEFRKNSVAQGELVLSEGNQEIRVRTVPSDIGDWNDLTIALKNLNLGDLSPFILKKNRVEGLLTGDITVEDPQNKMFVRSNLRTDQLRLDNDSIGRIEASISYNNITGELKGTGNNVDPVHKINFDLDLFLNDTAHLKEDRIVILPDNYPVKILERFIGTLFSQLQGFATGRIELVGEGANRRYIGKAKLHDAGLLVNFTQCFYKIRDTEIELKPTELDLGTLILIDTITKGTATVRGAIQHDGFKNMYFNLSAIVDNRPITLLNTSLNDNQQFYGRAKGTGSMSLVGPQSNMIMDINIKASETDSSFITLPPSRSRESGIANFLVERKYGREMTGTDFGGGETNITYEVNLTANPMVSMEVILDELTGDIIRGRGEGDLFIRAGTNEPLSIRGRYNIQEGNYDFTFQSFFKKPFELKKDASNYIEWTGDPYTATINFDAVYRAEDVSFSPLAQLAKLGSSISRYRDDVYVIAKLTGDLFRPKFDFKLEFPPNSLANTDPGLSFNIQQIQSNPNEINKQVTYLIVFNSFAPVENTPFNSSTFNEFAYNTISGLFFGEVNKRLNQWLSKILKNNDLTLNFSGSLYNRNLIDQNNSGGFSINQSNFNLTVGRAFFDDRFILTFGSTFDVPLQSTIQQTLQFLPDVTAEWLINKSGSIRATFFYRENLDFLTGNIGAGNPRTRRTGANMSYRREFNTLFGRKKTPVQQIVPKQNAVDSTGTTPGN